MGRRCKPLFVITAYPQLEAGRLPQDINPIHYNLEFIPNIYDGPPPFTFNGSMEFHFRADTETSEIYLNNVGLIVDEEGIELATHPDSPEPAEDPVLEEVERTPEEFYILRLEVWWQFGESFLEKVKKKLK